MPEEREARRGIGVIPLIQAVMPPPDERYFAVGERRYMASEQEWIASQLEEGDRITAVQATLCWHVEWGTGLSRADRRERRFPAVVRGSWFYDGLVLRVWDLSDIDHVQEVSLHMEWDRVET